MKFAAYYTENRALTQYALKNKKGGWFRNWNFATFSNGGEEEIRTLDPHVANVMLYQLSYFPMGQKRRVIYQITA